MVDLFIKVVPLFEFSKNDYDENNVDSIWPPVESKIYFWFIIKW